MPTKSTAKRPARKSTTKRKPAARRGTGEFGPRRFRLTISPGELNLVGPDGSVWGPAVCGVHRSAPVHPTSEDGGPEAPAGFDPNCEDCKVQAQSTADHALQHATV